MANAFINSGFECDDITTNDLVDTLDGHSGLVACVVFIRRCFRSWQGLVTKNPSK